MSRKANQKVADFDLKSMLKHAGQDPIETARRVQVVASREDAGHTRFIHKVMATSCAIFQHFEADKGEWKPFEQEPFFQDQSEGVAHRPREIQSLSAVLLYAFAATSEAQYNRCMKYAAGLQLLMDEGVEPRDIPKEIAKRGGIDELYSQSKTGKKDGGPGIGRAVSKKARPGATISMTPTEDDETTNDEEEEDWLDGEESDEEEDTTAADEVSDDEAAAGQAASKLAREAVAKRSDWLLVRLPSERLVKALSVEFKAPYWLKLQNTQGDDGLIRVRAVKFSRRGG